MSSRAVPVFTLKCFFSFLKLGRGGREGASSRVVQKGVPKGIHKGAQKGLYLV